MNWLNSLKHFQVLRIFSPLCAVLQRYGKSEPDGIEINILEYNNA